MSQYARIDLGPISVIALSRNGGVSADPYRSLNLGSYVGDNPNDVAQNFALVKQLTKADQLTWLHANHGTTVHFASDPGQAQPGDGLVTNKPKHGIVALSADCVPFALVDPLNQVVAVGHAGWKGVLANLMQVLAQSFISFGGNPDNSHAVIGPSICGSCYEVPADRVALFTEVMPSAIFDETHLTLSSGVNVTLTNLGFTVQQIPGCNFEDQNLFSYRRANGEPTGRGGLVAIIN